MWNPSCKPKGDQVLQTLVLGKHKQQQQRLHYQLIQDDSDYSYSDDSYSDSDDSYSDSDDDTEDDTDPHVPDSDGENCNEGQKVFQSLTCHVLVSISPRFL